MFAASFTRPTTLFAAIFGVHRTKTAQPRGPMPSWIDDPRLSEQLLRDTGLAREDLGGRPAYDDAKPFFMQRNFW